MSNLIDGYAPGQTRNDDSVAELRQKRDTFVAGVNDPEAAKKLTQTVAELAKIENELLRFKQLDSVYAATVHYGKGAFSGTGSSGGKPRPIFVLRRGDVNSPLKEVGPGAMTLAANISGDLHLSEAHLRRRSSRGPGQVVDQRRQSASLAIDRQSCVAISFRQRLGHDDE